MEFFLYKLFFNGDPDPGIITKAFHIVVSEDGVASALPIWLLVLILLSIAAVGYLIGSLNFSILISRFIFHDDIRNHGSHNAGSTNMNRTYGTWAGVLTLVGDTLKGVAASLLGLLLIGHTAAYIVGFFCILGHCFPVFFKFKGGKGSAPSAGVMLAADPIVGILVILIFCSIILGTRYVSLGSIIAALMFPLLLDRVFALFTGGSHPPFLMIISALLMTATVLFAHRSNIGRLLSGTENKVSFGKKKKSKDDEPAPRSLHHIDDDDDSDGDGDGSEQRNENGGK